MSVAFALVVLTGTLDPGHLTAAGQIMLLPGVASLVSNNVNDIAPEDKPVVKVKVQLPVKVAVTKFPFAKLIVAAVPVLPILFTVSP